MILIALLQCVYAPVIHSYIDVLYYHLRLIYQTLVMIKFCYQYEHLMDRLMMSDLHPEGCWAIQLGGDQGHDIIITLYMFLLQFQFFLLSQLLCLYWHQCPYGPVCPNSRAISPYSMMHVG